MDTNRMAYDALQTAMARQRVTVYDLYGLLDVAPNVDEAGIRRAYETIARKLHPEVPGNVINVAYSILVNPYKRTQYDRDRLEYLYMHFNSHESFLAPANLPSASVRSRDEQVQVYATTLVDRVKDPIEEKKKGIIRRIATIRNEVDEFNELSLKQRQDWATSGNRVLRMAGNALCEVVVCAEEDLRMLEDELGRVDGVLEPKDKDGPAGRVTSGQYGSDISAVNMLKGKPSVLMSQRIPSVPRSPTVLIHPKSASKLGVQGQDISGKHKDDTPSSEGSGTVTKIQGNDRVKDFLLGPSNTLLLPRNKTEKQRPGQGRMPSILETLTKPKTQSHVDVDLPSTGASMGLVDYQRIHGLRNVEEDLERDAAGATAQDSLRHSTNSADLPMNQRPASDSKPWRNSWDPAYVESVATPAGSFGLHITQPAARGSATASSIAMFKEVQDRAAAAARAPGRWVVGGPGLTNFGDSSAQEGKNGSDDPFA